MKTFNNVKILETDHKIKRSTKYGLHLNSSRKEQITSTLAVMVKSLLKKMKTSHIYLQWKEKPQFRFLVAQCQSQVMQHVNYPLQLMRQTTKKEQQLNCSLLKGKGKIQHKWSKIFYG